MYDKLMMTLFMTFRLRNDLLCVEWDVKPYTVTIDDFGKCKIYKL